MSTSSKLIYYDVADLNYTSFFLSGFYKNQRKFNYKISCEKKLPPEFLSYAMTPWWRRAIGLFKFVRNGDETPFCIDALDSCRSNLWNGFCFPLLEKVKYYFKVNYNNEAISNDLLLKKYHHIVAVPLFFPVRIFPWRVPFSKLGNILLRCFISNWMGQSNIAQNVLSMEEMRQLRFIKKDVDIFFMPYFYHEDYYMPLNYFRLQIMKEMSRYRECRCLMGFSSSKRLPPEYEPFRIMPCSLKSYLKSLARAKIAIYTRGAMQCLSFKLGQYLVIGKAIIGQKIKNNYQIFHQLKYFNLQFNYEEPKVIAAAAVQLLNDPQKLDVIAKSNSAEFDLNFTPESISSGMLNRLIKKE